MTASEEDETEGIVGSPLDLPRLIRERVTRSSFLRLSSWWRLYLTRFQFPSLIDLPGGERVLILSPHPDDDAMALGGTLVKHHQAGCSLTTLVLTDGAAGGPGGDPLEARRTRRAETEAAALHLGVERLIFWDEPDGALAANDENAARLREALQEMQPDLVYLPSFLEFHPDHRTVTPLLEMALQGSSLRFMCAIYEASTPIPANVLVDISGQMEAKLLAVREHQSQMSYMDYPGILTGFARWRSGPLSSRVQYAEAFYLTDVLDYIALWREARRR